MGTSCQKQNQLNKIKVATLNFSGINTSPFEYHDSTQECDRLNQLLVETLKRSGRQGKNWNEGKIDKNIRNRMCITTNRFTLTSEGKLPDRKQFQQIWLAKFDSSTQKTQPTQEQIQQCILYDYLNYLTVLQYVYKFSELNLTPQQFQASIKKLQPKPLLTYLQEKFDRPQCRIQIKQQVVMDYLLRNNIDVLFLQQAEQVDWSQDLPKEYALIKNSGSVIIWKKQKFGNVQQSLQTKYQKELNFNNDSVSMFSDKGYLLVSGHLKSSQQHVKQAEQMVTTLQKVLTDHPMLKMIIGIDANHFIKEESFPQTLNVQKVPVHQQTPTTLKKRTFLQVQSKKADKQISQVKDLIITNRKIQNYKIETVEGKNISKDSQKKEFIPNSNHPYDHYVVVAQIV